MWNGREGDGENTNCNNNKVSNQNDFSDAFNVTFFRGCGFYEKELMNLMD